MTYTYDPTTDRGRVRLLIRDTHTDDAAAQIFTDEEVDAFLAIEGDNIRLAAAQALDTMASNEAIVLKVVRIGDLSTNGAQVADALRKHAAELRRQDAEGSGDFDGMFEVAEQVYGGLGYIDRLHKQALRGVL
jgi:hypothetical protein